MKARFWVVGEGAGSLRARMNARLKKDRKRTTERAHSPLILKRHRKSDRRPGWSSAHSRNGGRGAVRYRWNARLKILECWAVTRGGNRPSQIIGEFVETVLDYSNRKIKSIHIDVS